MAAALWQPSSSTTFSPINKRSDVDINSIPAKKARYEGLVDHSNPDMISLGVLADLDRKLCPTDASAWHALNGTADNNDVTNQSGRGCKGAKIGGEPEKEAKEGGDNVEEKKEKIFIIPHNKLEEGCSAGAYWYKWLIKQIGAKESDIEIADMPDPYLGREVFWVPHMVEELHIDTSSVLIGHGIGASAVLRFTEDNRVNGLVLIDPACKHHDDPYLKASYYFDREWDWERIKENASWILLFSSHGAKDDVNSMYHSKYEQTKADEVNEVFEKQQVAGLSEQILISLKLGVDIRHMCRHSFDTSLPLEVSNRIKSKITNFQ